MLYQRWSLWQYGTVWRGNVVIIARKIPWQKFAKLEIHPAGTHGIRTFAVDVTGIGKKQDLRRAI
jgi:hypothetical protein